MDIDLGRATLAKTRTTTIRAATATTTLSVFAFRTSFHAQFIRLRVSATGARTGRSVLIGMANAPKVGCYTCEKMPADGIAAARFYAGFRHIQLRAVEKNLTHILPSIKRILTWRLICTLLRSPGRLWAQAEKDSGRAFLDRLSPTTGPSPSEASHPTVHSSHRPPIDPPQCKSTARPFEALALF